MCGIVYKSNFNSITNIKKFVNSCNLLNHRGPDDFGYYFNDNHSLGHRRLSLVDNNYKQPIISSNSMFMMDGYLTNYDELKEDEIRIDSLIVFNLFNKYGLETLNKINGAYALVYIKNDKVYAARDRFGSKPLYYSIYKKDIIIASEIKSIINYTKDTIVDKDGLCELLGMGPSHSVGKTVFKNIYEIPPGYYIEYDSNGLKLIEYYDVKNKILDISYSEAVKKVRKLLTNSIIANIPSDNNVSCLLSGGLDSSIVSTVVAKNVGTIDTYLIDYEDNDKEFVSNTYEITKDKDYAKLVSNEIKSNHNEIVITNEKVFEYLKRSVEYKDVPNMTDIDSSLLFLMENVKKKNRVCLSGECSDEIFAGYKWYYVDEEYLYGFPWIKALDFKESLLNDDYKLDLIRYVKDEYNKTINKIDKTTNHKIICYLNLKYFMTNLLDRSDRLSMASQVEVRCPFCDYKLIELLYNLPLSYKYRLKTEKKLLRDSFENELIKDVVERKKSPYPKNRAKEYDVKVKEELLNILKNKSILNEIFNKDKLIEFINDDDMEEPWYGQLMRKTSFIAYLYQIDYWFKKYNIRIDISGK